MTYGNRVGPREVVVETEYGVNSAFENGVILNLLKAKRTLFKKQMARAKRHYIPGCIWHIIHRCHKREFLFKFSRDRRRWMEWLFESKKRFGLTILGEAKAAALIKLELGVKPKNDL